MIPKQWIQPIGHDFRLMRTHIVTVFQVGLPWKEMVKLNKGNIFIITETQFAIQSQVM